MLWDFREFSKSAVLAFVEPVEQISVSIIKFCGKRFSCVYKLGGRWKLISCCEDKGSIGEKEN